MKRFSLAMPIALVLAAPLSAQSAPAKPLPSEVRLTPDQVDAVLDEAAQKRETAPLAENKPPLPIHGEVGFEVGTGGYRSIFGTVGTRLSDDGFASFSFDSSQQSPRHRRSR